MTEVLTEREEKRIAPLLEYLKEHEQIDNSIRCEFMNRLRQRKAVKEKLLPYNI